MNRGATTLVLLCYKQRRPIDQGDKQQQPTVICHWQSSTGAGGGERCNRGTMYVLTLLSTYCILQSFFFLNAVTEKGDCNTLSKNGWLVVCL